MKTKATPAIELFNGSDPPMVLTVDEAASLLGVSRSAVYTLVRTRVLDAIHIGRSIRIRSRDLFQFLGLDPTT